jgi:hypothetical protein
MKRGNIRPHKFPNGKPCGVISRSIYSQAAA